MPASSDLIVAAEQLAEKAHKSQFYGTGDPYIIHPRQTAQMAERMRYSDEVIAACYLHDVIEDTEVTEEELREQFPSAVVDAVVSVTFLGSDHDLKIKQAMSHPIGHVVKFCDVCCNLSNTVLHGAKEGKDASEVIPRRAGYLAELLPGLPSPDQIKRFLRNDT